ncbi:beta-1,4-glucuronyltransferase 1-like, partial [Diaphorina citri]|uniref:Beta-1,4-glucuronyltransferase 1 n=1 Tax=Diaphorina citri TaxID=121845 RepID=A0A1S4ER59_DIACI
PKRHLSNRYNICLATQSSIDKLDSLSEVAQHWSGPISLAVYVADDDEFSLLQGFVMFLQRCYDSITSQVALHILVPKSLHPDNKY